MSDKIFNLNLRISLIINMIHEGLDTIASPALITFLKR